MKSSTKQSGFAAVEAFLIIVVVALLGFTGWFVYHTKQATDKTLANTGNSNVSKPVKQAPPKSPVLKPTNSNYLVIQEWGIKIGFADADKVTYTAPTPDPGNYGMSSKAQTVNLELKPEVTTITACRDLGLGVFRDIAKAGDNNVINGYVYTITGGPGACDDGSNGTSAINQLRAKIDGDELPAATFQAAN